MKKKYYIYEMNISSLNIFSIIILILTFLLTYLIDKNILHASINQIFSSNLLNLSKFMLIYFGYMVLHEIFHSLAYVLMGADFKNITYGVTLEKGVFYCLCKQDITKKNILVSLLTPFFFLGILTLIISLIIQNKILLMLSIFNISGCSGDLMMFAFILKLPKTINYTEFDNDISFGILSDSDLSKYKHLGLNYKGEQNSVKRIDMTKIKISKGNKIILAIFFLSFLFYIIYSLILK